MRMVNPTTSRQTVCVCVVKRYTRLAFSKHHAQFECLAGFESLPLSLNFFLNAAFVAEEERKRTNHFLSTQTTSSFHKNISKETVSQLP